MVEPTYRKLKQELMIGAWPPGFRLEAMRLADELGVSMTPVRDSLNRLVGEHLVELKPGIGFFVARLSESRLRDLLEFNAALLVFAVQVGDPPNPSENPVSNHSDHALRIAQLFARIAASAGNAILTETVGSLSARLHAVRMFDLQLHEGSEAELEGIETAFKAADKDVLRELLVAYHDKRQRTVRRSLALLDGPTS